MIFFYSARVDVRSYKRFNRSHIGAFPIKFSTDGQEYREIMKNLYNEIARVTK